MALGKMKQGIKRILFRSEKFKAYWESRAANKSVFGRKLGYYSRNRKKLRSIIDKYTALTGAQKQAALPMIIAMFKYGFSYEEYFIYGVKDLSREQRKSYITEYNRFRYYRKWNSIEDDRLFDNKWDTYQRLKEFYKREAILIRDETDFARFRDFAAAWKRVVVKPLSLSCGQGIMFFDHLESEEEIAAALETIRGGLPCMVEEPIIQSEEMSALNPSSINTIRMCTIMKDDGTVVPFYPWLKTGRKGSRVDNGGAGGILSTIDLESGRVYTDGADEKCGRYETNPDYGYRYKEIQLPEWKKAVDLAVTLQKKFPHHRCTAWDMAHSVHGWIIVEGNSGGQFLQQIPLRCGLKAEIERLL